MRPRNSPSNTQIADSEFTLATTHSCVCVCVCVSLQVWLLVHSWITSGTHWTHVDRKEHRPLQFKGFWQVAFVNGKCVPQFTAENTCQDTCTRIYITLLYTGRVILKVSVSWAPSLTLLMPSSIPNLTTVFILTSHFVPSVSETGAANTPSLGYFTNSSKRFSLSSKLVRFNCSFNCMQPINM
jgi:hypothetical protein